MTDQTEARKNGWLLPRGFPVWRRGSCVPAAYLIARQLPSCLVVQGLVGPSRDEHSWVIDGNDVIDPTIRQFRWYHAGMEVRRNIVYIGIAATCIREFEDIYRKPWTDQGAAYKRFARWIDPVMYGSCELVLAKVME